jgi:hypothetical protein
VDWCSVVSSSSVALVKLGSVGSDCEVCRYVLWASRPVMICGQRIHKTFYGKMEEKERHVSSCRTFRIYSSFLLKTYGQPLLTIVVLLTICQTSCAAGKLKNCFVTQIFMMKISNIKFS